MIGFWLKKNFCDGWDNLVSLVIVNILYLLCLVGIVFLSAFFTSHLNENTADGLFFLIQSIIMFAGMFVLNIFSFAFGEISVKIANFEGVRLVDFFLEIPGVLKDSLLFSLLLSAIIFISGYSINYYMFQQQSVFGLFIGALLFWIDIFFVLSLQWFVPIRCTFHNNFKKCLKKCFIIFMDNTGLSIFMAFYNLLLIVISILPIGFFPSVGGVAISKQNALRLRLYKYDYLDEHPELKTKKERKNIPWDELLYDDKEALGPRKLKNFLFPWKE